MGIQELFGRINISNEEEAFVLHMHLRGISLKE